MTNPLIMPLRRILPPMGKIDTASVVAIVLFAAVKIAVLSLIDGDGMCMFDPIGAGVQPVLHDRWCSRAVALRSCMIFFFALLAGFLVQGGYSPSYALLGTSAIRCLQPFRRIIPPIVAAWICRRCGRSSRCRR